METMTTKQLAERYGLKQQSVANWGWSGQITPAGKEGTKNLYSVKEADAVFRQKNPNKKLPTITKAGKVREPYGSKKKNSVIQMALESKLGESTSGVHTGLAQTKTVTYFTADQVALLLRAMVQA